MGKLLLPPWCAFSEILSPLPILVLRCQRGSTFFCLPPLRVPAKMNRLSNSHTWAQGGLNTTLLEGQSLNPQPTFLCLQGLFNPQKMNGFKYTKNVTFSQTLLRDLPLPGMFLHFSCSQFHWAKEWLHHSVSLLHFFNLKNAKKYIVSFLEIFFSLPVFLLPGPRLAFNLAEIWKLTCNPGNLAKQQQRFYVDIG